jgi:WD40 repeat protein
VPEFQLLTADNKRGGHAGEVLACAFSPEGKFVLSAGWDGYLRLWETRQGTQVCELKAGSKPLSACRITPDGKRWLSGSMDGLLAQWDAMTQKQISMFLAHTRPISGMAHTSDGGILATTSWDRQAILWDLSLERDGRALQGHADIVAAGRFTPDGKKFISWSYDGTLRIWELASLRTITELTGHKDRITAGAVCPNGRWLVSASRDQRLKLWDLSSAAEKASARMPNEVRACFFLLDAVSLVTVDDIGILRLHGVPDLEVQTRLATRLPVKCAEVAPSGGQIALGCTDGRVYLVVVDGFDSAPLVVTPTQKGHESANVLQRLLGKSRVTYTYLCTCPACRQSFEIPSTGHNQAASCPYCRRKLRLSQFVRPVAEAAG